MVVAAAAAAAQQQPRPAPLVQSPRVLQPRHLLAKPPMSKPTSPTRTRSAAAAAAVTTTTADDDDDDGSDIDLAMEDDDIDGDQDQESDPEQESKLEAKVGVSMSRTAASAAAAPAASSAAAVKAARAPPPSTVTLPEYVASLPAKVQTPQGVKAACAYLKEAIQDGANLDLLLSDAAALAVFVKMVKDLAAPEPLETACDVLRSLAGRSDAGRAALAALGVGALAVSILRDRKHSPSVARAALSLMSQLAKHAETKAMFRADDNFKILIDTMAVHVLPGIDENAVSVTVNRDQRNLAGSDGARALYAGVCALLEVLDLSAADAPDPDAQLLGRLIDLGAIRTLLLAVLVHGRESVKPSVLQCMLKVCKLVCGALTLQPSTLDRSCLLLMMQVISPVLVRASDRRFLEPDLKESLLAHLTGVGAEQWTLLYRACPEQVHRFLAIISSDRPSGAALDLLAHVAGITKVRFVIHPRNFTTWMARAPLIPFFTKGPDAKELYDNKCMAPGDAQ